MATTTQTEIIRYTVGVLGAAPGGYMTDLEAIVAAGTTTNALGQVMADLMDDLNPTVAAYQSTATTTEFATAFMNNLLGSSVDATTLQLAIDVAVELIDDGGLTRSQLVVAAVDFLNSLADDDTTWGNAKSQLDNRVEAATYYTITGAAAASSDVATLQSAVASVTYDDTTVTTANAAVDAAIDLLPTADQTFTLAASSSSVTEGNTVTFTITADHALSSADDDVTLTYSVVGNTLGGAATAATAGTDFNPASGTVTFTAGETSKTVTMNISDDGATEGLEGLKFTLLDSAFAALGSATVSINDGATAGQTFTLTTSSDSGGSFTGTTGNDTYNGVVVADNGTGTTFNAGDNLTGGTGTDTLNVSVSGASTAAVTVAGTTLSGVEEVLVSNFDSNTDDAEDHEFNTSIWTGLTTVGLSSSSSTGDTSFTNIANVVDAEMASGNADLTVTYQSTLLTGTADSQKLTVAGATGGTFTVGNGGTAYAETLDLASSVTKNTLTLADNHHTTINITGDQALTLTMTDTANTTTKVDASAFTGALTLSGLGTTNIAITAGTGNDTVTAANLDANDTITGGDGTDTLKTASAITAASAKNVSGFEILELSATASQAANALTGLTGLSVNSTGAGNYTFSSAAGSETLYVKAVTAATEDVALTLATDTIADATTVTLGSTSAGVTFDDLTLDNAETITINNAVGSSTVATLISNDATKLVINASKALTITDALSASALGTIDASASTANVTLVSAASKASSITGGSGNDGVTGSSAADTILGGAGNDTISAGVHNDSVDGGAGDDSITAGAGNDTLAGGEGNDTFVDAAGDNDTTSTGVYVGSVSVSGDAGDDTFTIADFSDLTSGDTIAGGDGNDVLLFSETAAHNFTTDITILSNVTSVETFQFSALSGGETVTVNDAVVSAAGGTLNAKFSGTSAGATFNAANVTSSASKVVFTDAGSATAAIYSLGNGIDSVSLSDGTDTVLVSNNAYLAATDTLAGGSGADVLKFTYDTAGTQTITAAQLAGVTGFETFTVDNTDGTVLNYVFTLNDTIVGSQISSGSSFTIGRGTGEDGYLKVDGSAVTSSYGLTMTGGDGNATVGDTLIGGAGNDSITGGGSVDSLTGGAGNDTFVLDVADDKASVITDFDFGTSATAVDIIKVDGTTWDAAVTVMTSAVGTAGDYDVVVLNSATYSSEAAAETAANAVDNSTTEDIIIIYADSLGVVHVAHDADSDTDAGSLTDLATLSGVTITGIASLVSAGDFSLV